jgi:hypothetical protein
MNSAKSHPLNTLIEPLSALSLWLKISIVLLVAVLIRAQPTQPTWAVVMPIFAALVLVPIGLQLIIKNQTYFKITTTLFSTQLIAAILLAISFVFPQSSLAGGLAMPYFLWCLAFLAFILRGPFFEWSLTFLTTFTAFGFLTNAAAWLVFDRFGYQPMDFSAWIVLLTGAHFHYAGFALTLSLALLLTENPQNLWAKIPTIGVLSGVILTATGITATQFGFSHFVETTAGVWMSASAFLSGIAFLRKGVSEKSNARFLFIIGAVCLLLAMILAFFYALRNVIILDFLTIPTMQAIHGSLNALGFGTLTLLGFAFTKKNRTPQYKRQKP